MGMGRRYPRSPALCSTLQRQLYLCLRNHRLPLLCWDRYLGCCSCSMLPRCPCYWGLSYFIRLTLFLFQNPDETCAIDLETTEGTAWDMKVAPSWTTGADSTMDVTDDAEKLTAGSYTCTSLTDVSVRYEVSFHIISSHYGSLGCCWKRRHELIRSRALQLQPIQI